MDTAAAAAARLSRRRAKQALGAIRKATGLLAQVDDGFDSLGSVEISDERDIDRAVDLIRAALSERCSIDVVLLASTDPHGPEHGAKETHRNGGPGQDVQR